MTAPAIGLPAVIRLGAQLSAIPVVPWAKVITGQPSFGGFPFGTLTAPDTAAVLPRSVAVV